jgi:hypothetical protein
LEGSNVATTEQVVLLDETAAAIGTAPKHAVHDANTPLHLAFSCYVVDGEGHVLLTRRAAGKLMWPGVWRRRRRDPLPYRCRQVASGSFPLAWIKRVPNLGEEAGENGCPIVSVGPNQDFLLAPHR